MNEKLPRIAVIGLGYVGLPLAVAFGRRYPTIGFDIDLERVDQCQNCQDPNEEVSGSEFAEAVHLVCTNNAQDIAGVDFYIVAVPTPVDSSNRPDLSPLISACRTVGEVMAPGAIVVFESTVYPGATEEICVPELELRSGLECDKDFFIAYSPERVNPGDKEHTLEKITKLVAANHDEILKKTSALYGTIIKAGIYPVPTVKTAEAAKVIENTQRDLNIALVNELAIIFNRMGLDTSEVLAAAGTKWNFLPFRPGLVGGHCIGVDPYYLTYKAEAHGYHPQVILAGRRINDGMGKYIAEQTIKTMSGGGVSLKESVVVVLGVTFKENFPDLRNSQVFKIRDELESYGITVNLHDPVADPALAEREYGAKLLGWNELPTADALVLAVNHKQYIDLPIEDLKTKLRPTGAVIDVKSTLSREAFRNTNIKYWRL